MIVFSRAPLRVSLAGGGTDTEPFCSRHGGCVLSCAIAKYAWVRMDTEGSGHCTRYPLFASRDTRLIEAIAKRFRPVSLEVRVDARERSGLGGSGALGVATIGCLNMLNSDEPLDLDQIAELACQVELEDLRVPGGRQDQYIAAYGGLCYLQFGQGRVGVARLTLKPETLLSLQRSLFLVFIHPRTDEKVIKDEVASVEAGNKDTIAALDRQKELANEMRRVLRHDDLTAFGGLLHEAWSTKRRQSPSASTPRVDEFYEAVRKAGALGGKLVGAGGGGYFIVFAPGREGQVCEAILERGLIPEPVVFEPEGLRVW